MRIAVLVNHPDKVSPQQSTTLLMRAAGLRGHEVWALGVGDLEVCTGTEIYANARPVNPASSTAALVMALRSSQPRRLRLETFDAMLIRTNPGREPRRIGVHECALSVARMAEARGVAVLNAPDGLARAATKMSLFELPAAVRPATFVARNVDALEEFIESLGGPAVIKPVRGSRGQDVFRMSRHDRSNQRQVIDVIRRDGYVMVQEYVPGAEAGDQRVLVVGGNVLEIEGRAAVVARVPRAGDFRSNVHAGGRPKPGELTPEMRGSVAAVSQWLDREGLFFVGLDFIGACIIEVNAFSPGGLGDAASHQDRQFDHAIIQAVEQRVCERREIMDRASAATG
jgi:glutathione synthase